MNILLIDNDDSFTYNLAQALQSLGADVITKSHRDIRIADIEKEMPDAIVLSPGPGHPKDARTSRAMIKTFAKRIPILGVCLGHQCLAQVFDEEGSPVVRAPEPVHGKTSDIFHDGTGIFAGIPSPFSAARYHSLIVKRLPHGFVQTGWTGSASKPALIMAMAHESLPLIGVQFHPESFLTAHGMRILKNFLALASRHQS